VAMVCRPLRAVSVKTLWPLSTFLMGPPRYVNLSGSREEASVFSRICQTLRVHRLKKYALRIVRATISFPMDMAQPNCTIHYEMILGPI
jgi:hypothetical protein